MANRRLSADEAALWARVMATVTPLPGAVRSMAVAPEQRHGAPTVRLSTTPRAPAAVGRAPPRPPAAPGVTLDAAWDRRLARGTVVPDVTVDLHGHSLRSAYDLLDQALGRSMARGDRVVLLITGKPPGPDSERPHARGAIRSAVGDWLRASRHAGDIAAVRGASPRHGGGGALYIVLRRTRAAPKS